MITKNPQANPQTQFNSYPYYAPRIWHGLSTSTWCKLAVEHRFQIDRFDLAAWVTFFGLWNSALNRIQALKYKRRAAACPLPADPLFIIGHWRTGTTLLHALLALDERYATPNNYQCFTPRHFLISEDIVTKILDFPRQRPMDNINLSWTEPQEDELALCVRGFPSVFRNNAFPKHRKQYLEWLTMDRVPRRRVRQWQGALMEFVRYLNYKYRRPLVLKSPPHTGRIRTLLQIFPNAKFIHLTRSPRDFIPSTVHLWKALDQTNGFQNGIGDVEYLDYVFECFQCMYSGFHQQKAAIPDRNFCEMRYDDLISSPVETLGAAYATLGLQEFQVVEPAVHAYMQSQRDYQRNEHTLPSQLELAIRQHCSDYCSAFGYETDRSRAKAA
jgi:hypothetical protein